jgi:hypothetical protein
MKRSRSERLRSFYSCLTPNISGKITIEDCAKSQVFLAVHEHERTATCMVFRSLKYVSDLRLLADGCGRARCLSGIAGN